MSIAPQLDNYLGVRRSLGYDLRTDERVLRRFARFADQEGAAHIDTALFLRWDASLPDVGTSTRSARLGKVRLFAEWLWQPPQTFGRLPTPPAGWRSLGLVSMPDAPSHRCDPRRGRTLVGPAPFPD
jgi:hypothetical protein